ncbi:MAG: leucine-rich repeat domain-containing protein, partial [Lachnospiraceae bacterium]|nr:leucine-rich repeat domain-containing protein [Lachnospiraceae bacterium]
MKKLFIISVLLALVINGFAQILHYDFPAVCETGQTLYYRITSEEEHTVTLTYPYSEENPAFEDYYDNYNFHIPPTGEIVLPSIVTHNGIDYSVTAIDHHTFYQCELTGSLIIPEGVASIGFCAFSYCSFTSVYIPQSVRFIDPSPLTHCYSLGSISVDEANPTFYSESNTIIRREDNALVVGCITSLIPDGVEIICKRAFQGASNGNNVVLPNSVRTIEEYAFFHGHHWGTLTLSETLETIGSHAFSQCSFSGSLTIPNSVTEIGRNAFCPCSGFTGELILSSSITTIDTAVFANCGFSGVLIIPASIEHIGLSAFSGNNFSELVLGNSLVSIEAGGFQNCTHLSGTLLLPNSLTTIGHHAFANTSFDEIHSPNTIPPVLGQDAFQNYDPNIPIYIPFGSTEVYQNAEGWNYFTNFIEEEPILYTDYEPDSCFTPHYDSDTLKLDLDQNGTDDVVFASYYQSGVGQIISMHTVNEWKWCISYAEEWIPLTDTTIINETLRWEYASIYNYLCPGMYPEYTHYAFRQNAGDGYHYAWARIRVESFDNVCIDEMAYCTIPNYPLQWGQTNITEGLEEETIKTDFTVYPNPAKNVLFVETRRATSLPDPTYRIT